MDINNHPCFNDKVRHKSARIHLPVASRCNIQCKFCNRKFDCVNESRPGVTSAVLTPMQAGGYLDEVIGVRKNISVVGIAGPGDPFANAEETLETLSIVRAKYPEMLLCVASNGLNVTPYVEDIKRLKVSHVTITVNAVDPVVGGKIYSYIRYGKKVLRGDAGAEILYMNQLNAIKALKKAGVVVKVNAIIIPGINNEHIEKVAEKMRDLEVDILNCVPYYPNDGSIFRNIEEPSKEMVKDIRKKAGKFIKQMHHCTRCRADAVGLLGEKTDIGLMKKMIHWNLSEEDRKIESTALLNKRVAVASMEGLLVNQHLGEASRLLIYGKEDGEIKFIESRKTPERGAGVKRWNDLSKKINDCGTLLVSGIGNQPKKILNLKGIHIHEVEGLVEDAVSAVLNGESVDYMKKREMTECGAVCMGSGEGCG